MNRRDLVVGMTGLFTTTLSASDLAAQSTFINEAVSGMSGAANLSELKALIERPRYLFLASRHSPGDGGEGIFQWMPDDRAEADDVLVISPTAGPAGRYKRKVSGSVNAKWWGAKGDGTTDDTDALMSTVAYWVAHDVELVIPAGVYTYRVSPNFAKTNGRLSTQGEVRFRYTGSGNALVIDAGEVDGYCNHLRLGSLTVEASSGARHGVYVRGVHRSCIEVSVRGCGSTSAALRVDFAVCTEFRNFTCSNNEGEWFGGAQPKYGIWLDQRQPAQETSYCLFTNPIIEGLETGIYLANALGNVFLGGTSEGHSLYGIFIGQNSRINRFYGLDFEVNSRADIFIEGYSNEFHGIDSEVEIQLAGMARLNRFSGGNAHIISLGSRTKSNVFDAIVYNRFGTNGTIRDEGTYNAFARCIDAATSEGTPGNPRRRATPSVGPSPFLYTNRTGNRQDLYISGGSVSLIELIEGNISDEIAFREKTAYGLRPGDSLKITYESKPKIVIHQA